MGQGLIPFSKQPLLCLQPAGWGRGKCGSSSRSGHTVFAFGLCHTMSEGIINQVLPSTELHPSPSPAAINTSSACCGVWRAFGLVFMVTLFQQVCGFRADAQWDFVRAGLCQEFLVWSEDSCGVLGPVWGKKHRQQKAPCPPASRSPARPPCSPCWLVHMDAKHLYFLLNTSLFLL